MALIHHGGVCLRWNKDIVKKKKKTLLLMYILMIIISFVVICITIFQYKDHLDLMSVLKSA